MDPIAGEVFIAPLPRCPVHGQMKSRYDGWVCVGWDGEGCDYELPGLDQLGLFATPLGHVGSIEWADGSHASRKWLNAWTRSAPGLPT